MLTVSDTARAIVAVRAQEAELGEGGRLVKDPYASIFAADALARARDRHK